jgi:plastocyanin
MNSVTQPSQILEVEDWEENMSRFQRAKAGALRGQNMQTVRRLGMFAALLTVIALLVAACGPAPEPAALPTSEVAALPTDEPTAAPAAEPTPQPAPTEAPAAESMITPSVTVADQEIVDGQVTIAEVVSDGPGWLAIHAQADGKPGPILGYSAVTSGANAAVMVAVDASSATETLYAMLHTDAGEIGTWEFPNGPDAPVMVGEQVVTPAFAITGGLAMGEEILPSVTVTDQEIMEDRVTIAEVVSNGPGWLVVHAQADGKPGPILGYSAVTSGANAAVMVAIDASSATETLYAMLHTDAGEIGTWEFPNGPDAPVMVGEQVVTPSFKASIQATASQSSPTAVATAPSNTSSDIPTGAVVVTGDEAEVEMEDFKFNPPVLVIRPGTTVKFANKDEAPHTATSDTGVFDSSYLSKGEEYFYTFTEPGTYPYYCIPHGGPGGQGMAATIIVQP